MFGYLQFNTYMFSFAVRNVSKIFSKFIIKIILCEIHRTRRFFVNNFAIQTDGLLELSRLLVQFLTKILIFDKKIWSFDINVDFDKNFDFWQKNLDFWYKCWFWQKFWFLTKKIWIFDINVDFDKNLAFWQKFGFLTKIWIVDKNLDFWTNVLFFQINCSRQFDLVIMQ